MITLKKDGVVIHQGKGIMAKAVIWTLTLAKH